MKRYARLLRSQFHLCKGVVLDLQFTVVYRIVVLAALWTQLLFTTVPWNSAAAAAGILELHVYTALRSTKSGVFACAWGWWFVCALAVSTGLTSPFPTAHCPCPFLVCPFAATSAIPGVAEHTSVWHASDANRDLLPICILHHSGMIMSFSQGQHQLFRTGTASNHASYAT